MALPVGRIENASSVLGPVSNQQLTQREDFFKLGPKEQLSYFCATKLSRAIAPQDIVYMSDQYAQGFQSVVRMCCLDGQEFAGEIRQDKVKAEEAAAAQAMLVYKAQATLLIDVAVKKRKAVAPPTAAQPALAKKIRLEPGVLGMPGWVPQQSADVVATNKMELSTHCARIARKIMEKTDICFETKEVDEGGFQAILRLNCLPGVWSSRTFVGQVCKKKAEAEQSTAGVALAAIKKDAFLMSKFNEPPKVKNKGRGKGSSINAPAVVPPTVQGFSYPPHFQVPIPGIPQTGFWG
ncbi:aurkb-a [Symbiodinium sp. CCMP2592]|nr:aurkb-a [Symbiodinium sp. CCMP2592]